MVALADTLRQRRGCERAQDPRALGRRRLDPPQLLAHEPEHPSDGLVFGTDALRDAVAHGRGQGRRASRRGHRHLQVATIENRRGDEPAELGHVDDVQEATLASRLVGDTRALDGILAPGDGELGTCQVALGVGPAPERDAPAPRHGLDPPPGIRRHDGHRRSGPEQALDLALGKLSVSHDHARPALEVEKHRIIGHDERSLAPAPGSGNASVPGRLRHPALPRHGPAATIAAVPPVILHADMDAFYASVEQHDRPELRGKPVIVGGTGPRGVVTAASYEARPYGVRSAMPAVEARRLCPHAVFLPGRMSRYAEVSREIRRVFGEFTPLVEPLSLDEAFLDVTASLRLFGTPTDVGRAVKRRIREATGLAVSVGIGPSRMVAKIASDLSKPDGLLEVLPAEVESFLRPLPVRRLWGVGPVAGERLSRLGITTIGDLADRSVDELERDFGDHARALHDLARGIDPRPVDPALERKSYGEENTFADDVSDGESLRGTIVSHAEAVARRLRADGRRGRTIVLKVKLARRIAPGRYPLLTRSRTLPEPTDDGKVVSDTALVLWNELARGTVIRLVGVSVTNLEEAGDGQLDLFRRQGTARRAALNQALDAIAARFGEEAVTRGAGRVERAAPTLSIKDRPR